MAGDIRSGRYVCVVGPLDSVAVWRESSLSLMRRRGRRAALGEPSGASKRPATSSVVGYAAQWKSIAFRPQHRTRLRKPNSRRSDGGGLRLPRGTSAGFHRLRLPHSAGSPTIRRRLAGARGYARALPGADLRGRGGCHGVNRQPSVGVSPGWNRVCDRGDLLDAGRAPTTCVVPGGIITNGTPAGIVCVPRPWPNSRQRACQVVAAGPTRS